MTKVKLNKTILVNSTKDINNFPFHKILIVLIILNPFLSIGQNPDNRDLIVKNNIYTQYDLSFNVFSINYERTLTYTKENNPFLLSIGLSHTTPNFNSHGFNWYGVPVWISTYYGHNKSHFETGFGYWWTKSYNQNEFYKDKNRTENTFLIKVCYRYQKLKNNGLNFRIGAEFGFYRSFTGDYWDTDIIGSLLLISIGYSF